MACCWLYANNNYILLVLQPNLGWEICHSLVRSHFRVPNTRRPSTGALGGIVSRTQGVKIKPLWSCQQLSQQAISIRLPAFSKAHFQWEMNTHPPPSYIYDLSKQTCLLASFRVKPLSDPMNLFSISTRKGIPWLISIFDQADPW